jgi:hypothetical protein
VGGVAVVVAPVPEPPEAAPPVPDPPVADPPVPVVLGGVLVLVLVLGGVLVPPEPPAPSDGAPPPVAPAGDDGAPEPEAPPSDGVGVVACPAVPPVAVADGLLELPAEPPVALGAAPVPKPPSGCDPPPAPPADAPQPSVKDAASGSSVAVTSERRLLCFDFARDMSSGTNGHRASDVYASRAPRDERSPAAQAP